MPVRDAFRKLSQLDAEARRRAAAEYAAVGTVDEGPSLVLDERDRGRVPELQGVLAHTLQVLRDLQPPG